MFKTFDENRPQLMPYGFTLDLWRPSIMSRPDQHNEIEVNFLRSGSLTYLINGRKTKISEKSLCVFWGLAHHQIVEIDLTEPYYVFTIPLADFLKWDLPVAFIEKMLKGDLIIESTETPRKNDELLFEAWLSDIASGCIEMRKAVILEIRARLHRLAISLPTTAQENHLSRMGFSTLDTVNQVAFYIACNYSQPISCKDVGHDLKLHPDYANFVFRKAFGITISQYLREQRILHAQRKLICSNEPIATVAYECGFNSISRFNQTFRKTCQCSPTEYRKRHQLMGL